MCFFFDHIPFESYLFFITIFFLLKIVLFHETYTFRWAIVRSAIRYIICMVIYSELIYISIILLFVAEPFLKAFK